jgi:hypothetical protein
VVIPNAEFRTDGGHSRAREQATGFDPTMDNRLLGYLSDKANDARQGFDRHRLSYDQHRRGDSQTWRDSARGHISG